MHAHGSSVPRVCLLRLPAGTEFEKRILANEANNQKFSFLKDGDPYNAYYRQKVRSVLCQRQQQQRAL